MNYISQIQLGSKGYLDISQDVSIPLNLSVAEIQDISKRQGGYSKTIVLPSTSNNDNLFGHLFDVNIVDGTFDLNKKEKCLILQNGVPVFDGYLQLLNVTKTSPAMPNGDEQVSYEVQVKDTSGDFFSSMQDKYLEDLSGFDQYNHKYTLSAITATSGNTWEDVYKYHMTFNQKQIYNLQDFTPSIFAKAYLDRIFLDAGYTYQWPSLSDTLFDKMVIPYNGDKPYANLNDYTFRAGFLTGNTQSFTASTFTDNFNMIFSDDFTAPNFDTGNTYSTSTGKWTASYNGTVNVKTAYHYEIGIYAPVACYLEQHYEEDPFDSVYITDDAFLRLALKHHFYRGIVDIPITNGTFYDVEEFQADGQISNAPIIPTRFYISAGYSSIHIDITPEFNALISVQPTNTVFNNLETKLTYAGDWFKTGLGTALPDAQIPRIVVKTGINATQYDSNYFKNAPTASLGEGMTVYLQEFIPKKVKQKDFLSSLVKMMNLYITPSKDNDKTLIFETRDEFYDNGGIIDWTSKFVADQDTKIQFLPELQNKKLTFTYKPDNDLHNTTYKLATGENYGQLQYTFANEFVQNIQTIEPIFSPTPLNENGIGILVPTIDSNIPKNNIRILFDGDWIPNNSLSASTWAYGAGLSGATIIANFSKYPYAGHLYPTPIQPTDDLNFGLVDYLYYNNWDNVTDNNLYNKYWKRYVNQIETGKLMTARFKLNEYDILNLNFRDKIWIHDTYWFLNKIVDYNANSNNLTTVELISVDEGIKFNPSFPLKATNPIKDNGIKFDYIKNQTSFETRFERNLFGGSANLVEVLGDGNIIQAGSEKSVVLGNDNTFAGTQNFIIGNNNNVQGTGVIAFGVSGQTLSDSNVITFGIPVVATTISATSITIGNTIITGATSPFVAGSAGVFNAKLDTDTATDSTGNYAVAEGESTLASGTASHAEGQGSIASGVASHAEGQSGQAIGNYSHVEGQLTTASGPSAHAEGTSTTASGPNSHAEGIASISSGPNSHAGGDTAIASKIGEWARSGGNGLITNRNQYGIVDYFRQTGSAALTEMFIGGDNATQDRFTLASGDVVRIRLTATAVNTGTGDVKEWTAEGLMKNIGGTSSAVGTFTTISTFADAGMTTTSLGISVSNAVDALIIEATGLAATTINWYVKVEYIKVTQ